MSKSIHCAAVAAFSLLSVFLPVPFASAQQAPATEQQWLVSEIRSNIARLAGGSSTPAQDVRIATHVWDPDAYVAFARERLGPGRTGLAEGQPELLSGLTTPTVDTLLHENVSVSNRLAENRRAPGPHEDAALLIGTFALREAAGPFSDIRGALSRMTAHLAIARALDGRAGRNGRAAEILLVTLAGRQQDALDRLAAWKSARPDGAERAWINTLALRASGDWRQLDAPAHASLLERIAYVRALQDRVGTEKVVRFLDESRPEPVIDWGRLITSYTMPVDVGRAMGSKSTDVEVSEATYVWRALEPSRAIEADSPEATVDLINTPPASRECVLDWPTWAAAYQRHLAQQVAAAVNHEHWQVGRKDEAQALAVRLEERYGHLTLYPFAKRHYAIDVSEYRSAMAGAARIARTHPELVTSANFTLLGELTSLAPLPTDSTSATAWFAPLVLDGTGFDVAHRLFGPRHSLLAFPDALKRLRTIAPFERDPLFELMRIRFGDAPRLAEFERDAGAHADFDATVIRRLTIAASSDEAAYRRIAGRLCEMTVDECDDLAAYLADRDADAEAAALYQKWADGARDRVGVSNRIGWLVKYYEDHGEKTRAVALADEAAAVYSFRGLATKADLLERAGKFDEAETTWTKIKERYERYDAQRAAFYLRWAAASGDESRRRKAAPLVARIFPAGMKPSDGTAPEGAPQDGVRVTATGARGAAAGFHANDIIVAVDGISVHDYDQVALVWRMNAAPAISFTVWNGTKYVEIRGDLRERWQSGQFIAYDYRVPSSR